MIDCPMCLGVY